MVGLTGAVGRELAAEGALLLSLGVCAFVLFFVVVDGQPPPNLNDC